MISEVCLKQVFTDVSENLMVETKVRLGHQKFAVNVRVVCSKRR